MSRGAWMVALALLGACRTEIPYTADGGCDSQDACTSPNPGECCTSDDCGEPHECALSICGTDGTCQGGLFPSGVICMGGAGHCDGHGTCIPGGCNVSEDCGVPAPCHTFECHHAACVDVVANPGTKCLNELTCDDSGNCL